MIAFLTTIIGCAGPVQKGGHKLKVRLTFYTNHEDKYGSKIAMSSKMRAKQGITVAAHPQFQFGTKIMIPGLKGILNDDGMFIVQDRGSAVTKKKASGGLYYVFDVFLNADSRRTGQNKINHYQSLIDPIEDVYVLN